MFIEGRGGINPWFPPHLSFNFTAVKEGCRELNKLSLMKVGIYWESTNYLSLSNTEIYGQGTCLPKTLL